MHPPHTGPSWGRHIKNLVAPGSYEGSLSGSCLLCILPRPGHTPESRPRRGLGTEQIQVWVLGPPLLGESRQDCRVLGLPGRRCSVHQSPEGQLSGHRSQPVLVTGTLGLLGTGSCPRWGQPGCCPLKPELPKQHLPQPQRSLAIFSALCLASVALNLHSIPLGHLYLAVALASVHWTAESPLHPRIHPCHHRQGVTAEDTAPE